MATAWNGTVLIHVWYNQIQIYHLIIVRELVLSSSSIWYVIRIFDNSNFFYPTCQRPTERGALSKSNPFLEQSICQDLSNVQQLAPKLIAFYLPVSSTPLCLQVFFGEFQQQSRASVIPLQNKTLDLKRRRILQRCTTRQQMCSCLDVCSPLRLGIISPDFIGRAIKPFPCRFKLA